MKLAAALFLSCMATAAGAVPAQGQALPPVCFSQSGGARGCVADFRGEFVVLNLWATYCAPCVRELPMLDRMQERYRAQGVRFVALAVDRRGPAAVRRMREKLGITHLADYLDTEARAMDTLGVRAIPVTLLVGRDGNVVQRYRGELNGDALARDLDTHLSPPSRTEETTR